MEKSYLKTESYLSEIKEAIYSKNREHTIHGILNTIRVIS